ncbi:hypothetical protein AAC387_Pa04g2874 [Persea americana]
MALRLPRFPSTVFGGKTQQKQQKDVPNLFSWPKPSQFKAPLSLSFSPLTRTRTRNPNNNSTLFFPVSLATQQQLQTLSSDSQQQQEPIPDRTRLIAQNIPWTCSAQDIRSLFEKHGTVTDVELSMFNKFKNRGLAFVTMGSEEEALAALENLDSYELDGRVIKVEFSRSLKKKPSVTADSVKMYDVFVGNLAWKVTSSDLTEFFGGENGNALRAEVVYHTNPRRPAGYGFVSFSSKEEVEAAIANYDGKELMGRSIRLHLSKKDNARFERESKGSKFKEESVKVNDNEGPANNADEVSSEAE